MKELRFNIWKFIFWAILMALLCALFILLISGAETQKIISIFLNYGYITTPILLIWILIDNIWWRTFLMQSKFINNRLGIPPNLRGRWVGVLERMSENDSHSFALEIKQTMTNMQIYGHSSRGKSHSITHSFIHDSTQDDYILCFHWQGTHGKLVDETTESTTFVGFSSLSYRETDEGRFLDGEYFTNRQPKQTMGKIRLKFESTKLKKHL